MKLLLFLVWWPIKCAFEYLIADWVSIRVSQDHKHLSFWISSKLITISWLQRLWFEGLIITIINLFLSIILLELIFLKAILRTIIPYVVFILIFNSIFQIRFWASGSIKRILIFTIPTPHWVKLLYPLQIDIIKMNASLQV